MSMTPEQKAEVDKFFNSLGIIAGTAGKAYGSNGGFGIDDLPYAIELLARSGEIMDGFDDMDVVFEGMKFMSVDQIIDAIKDGVNIGKTYETKRKESKG